MCLLGFHFPYSVKQVGAPHSTQKMADFSHVVEIQSYNESSRVDQDTCFPANFFHFSSCVTGGRIKTLSLVCVFLSFTSRVVRLRHLVLRHFLKS